MLVSETDAAFIRGLSAAARGRPIVRPNPDEDDSGVARASKLRAAGGPAGLHVGPAVRVDLGCAPSSCPLRARRSLPNLLGAP
jgi:hypothetical protein